MTVTKDVMRQTAVVVGRGLRMARAHRFMTQGDVAQLMGWKNGQPLSTYENGTRTPGLETIQKLSQALRVPMWAIFALGAMDFERPGAMIPADLMQYVPGIAGKEEENAEEDQPEP